MMELLLIFILVVLNLLFWSNSTSKEKLWEYYKELPYTLYPGSPITILPCLLYNFLFPFLPLIPLFSFPFIVVYLPCPLACLLPPPLPVSFSLFELFNSNLETSSSFTCKYFSVYFLRIIPFSYITSVPIKIEIGPCSSFLFHKPLLSRLSTYTYWKRDDFGRTYISNGQCKLYYSSFSPSFIEIYLTYNSVSFKCTVRCDDLLNVYITKWLPTIRLGKTSII